MARIEYRGVTKFFPGALHPAVEDMSLQIEDGEFLVLVGPSGCGKTTALRLVAGLETISDGEILLGDQPIEDLPARKRDVAMVFQSYALYPHMTVEQNIAFGLQNRKVGKAEIRRRVCEASQLLQLDALLKRRPAALSGGQRQRVAMGRAIVREPQAFLMDEPLSNLDARLRVEMRASLKKLHQKIGVTTIYVTHDQVEAMTLGDRVAVLLNGRLQQVATPERIFDRPANTFVAGFVGSPPMNLALARLVRDSGLHVVVGDYRFPVPSVVSQPLQALDQYVGEPLVVGVRPSDIHIGAPPEAGYARMPARVRLMERLGTEANVMFELRGVCSSVSISADQTADESSAAAAIDVVDEYSATTWTARVSTRAQPKAEAEVDFGLDTTAMQFFDANTGNRIE